MAKNRGSRNSGTSRKSYFSNNTYSHNRRDASRITSGLSRDEIRLESLLSPQPTGPLPDSVLNDIRPLYDPLPLLEIEDRRRFHPGGRNAPPKSFRSSPAKQKPKTYSLLKGNPLYAFAHPKKTIMCVRRKMRTEVMHALGFAGKGGGKQRKPRFNANSKVHC